jgi:HAD superfamily hydrolase (TIGR01490 family)
MELALFDLDNTLLSGDSDFEWAQYLISRGVLDAEVYAARNQQFYDQYRAGTLDIHEFLDFQLKPLARHPRAELDRWRLHFMETRILPIITDAARALVEHEKARCGVVAIVTATNSFVTRPIADELGVEHLIATEPEEHDGAFTGRVRGIPSFREGKVTRLEAWLSERGQAWSDFTASRFYSDSLNDLPLLEKVSGPIAVDPDDTLRRRAAERGWPIITLR